ELSRRHHGQRAFTGLPGSGEVEAEITRLMNGDEEFAFLSIDVDHFQRFNENFGYGKGDDVLSMLARLLADVMEEEGAKVRFVGHLGGDDYVALTSSDSAQRIAEALTQRFDTESRAFFTPRDLERGYFEMVNRSGRREMVPLLALTIAIVDNVRGR